MVKVEFIATYAMDTGNIVDLSGGYLADSKSACLSFSPYSYMRDRTLLFSGITSFPSDVPSLPMYLPFFASPATL